MAQTPAQRKAAQRKNARLQAKGQNPLGGEFRRYYEQRLEQIDAEEFVSPPQEEYLGGEGPSIIEEEFSEGAGLPYDIPLDYDPTKTTWPGNGWDHRRTTRAGYDRDTETLSVEFFTNGAIYYYYHVPQDVAKAFRRAASPGKFINAVLNSYPYERIE
jgi:hypothetical protein